MSNIYYSLSEDYGDPGEEVTEIEIIEVTVSNTTPDLDFPVMTNYTLTPSTVTDGDTVTITVDVSDAGVTSGIGEVYAGVSLELPSDDSLGALTSCIDIGGGLYQGTFFMDNFYENGTWCVDEIEIRDNAGNITTYDYDDWIDNDNLIRYYSDNEDNYIVTTFDVKSFVKN